MARILDLSKARVNNNVVTAMRGVN